MLEQEASMLQNSFASSGSWLPNVFNAWEEPFVMMRKVSEEMDQYFGKMMQAPMGKIAQNYAGGSSSGRNWTPTVEVAQLGDQMVICADLPGLTKEDVQLKVHEDKITIQGERREENISQDVDGYHRTERSYGRFYRSIPLPEGVDGSEAEAKMRDGVLEITIPLPQGRQRGIRLDIREAQEGELREQKEAPRSKVINEQTRRDMEEGAKSAQHASQEPRRDQQNPRQTGNASARTEAKV
ncbi:hypothetical protein GCM10022212_36450 [Actimicrobium antarcticum]|uniref:SHSP domain-containing protein n=2 Tax=Actimicrobium antarcticum TaxID=1051899 RepID=A0ABP7U0M4_9BURK